MNLFRKLEKSQACDQCGEKFHNEKELKGHILSVHEGKKVFKCSICKDIISDRNKMKRHLVSIHGKGYLMNFTPKKLLRMNLFFEIKDSQSSEKKEHIVSSHEKQDPLDFEFHKKRWEKPN